MLQKDPHFRPTAAEIVDVRIPRMLDALVKDEGGDWFLDQDSLLPLQNSVNRNSKPQRFGHFFFSFSRNKSYLYFLFLRSVLYDFKHFDSPVTLIPITLPPKIKVKEIAVSNTHFIALTSELIVYTWGENSRGQLGHGDSAAWKQTPMPVESLRGKSIKMVGAGDGYSVFVSDSGMLMTCGDGTFGCLGHGDWNNVSRPKLIGNYFIRFNFKDKWFNGMKNKYIEKTLYACRRKILSDNSLFQKVIFSFQKNY